MKLLSAMHLAAASILIPFSLAFSQYNHNKFALRVAHNYSIFLGAAMRIPHPVSPLRASVAAAHDIRSVWPVFLFVDFKVTCCLFSYVGVHTRRQHTGAWIGWSARTYERERKSERVNVCAQRGRSVWCIVMHVDKAIRRHVLRMLHASAGLCTWHRTDRWTPCRFHFPHRTIGWTEGGAPAGLSVPLFFSGFLPLFSGASGFRVAVFLRSFRYSRVVLLLLHPLSLSLSTRVLFLSRSFSLFFSVYRSPCVSKCPSLSYRFFSH